ncbi:hypothetical protein ETB97_007484 [Aspergillus alliaceus]|uniref:Uncharacterized protein n=1 Tax=Petromyces alliaceus TaxID=209559 RepID=A0A5N6FUL3_PETAA|nr:uncharacterized protein BDW43DRAFT_311355 [Aspergillus alliaceus]KAB8233277.1 hypothetical protein BDW43DRAFT_311355 [Aspergillus alliaceus]KAF5856353.1 hypothetical protein ETB97_007484 [Aspergillus burnettii]
MAYDCYCAICGVGFSGMHIESPSETAIERRRRWIEKRCRALEAGQDISQIPAEENDAPVRSYDPRLVDTDNISWLFKAYCLGSNPPAPGTSGTNKAFISGPGYYADIGELVVKPGKDLYQPSSRKTYMCYDEGTEEASGPVLPFHWSCFEILTRALTDATEIENINLDALYSVMSALTNHSSLHVNYGDDISRSQGRYWECVPGAEYCAKCPTDTPMVDELFQNLTTDSKFKYRSEAGFEPQDPCPSDPFGHLPMEIAQYICMFLPGDSVNALAQASPSVQVIAKDNSFWKRFMRWDMPWFWELQTLQKQNDVDYRELYMWLNKMTTPRYGMDDLKLMGVANRRRIWGVCEQLASRYNKTTRRTPVEAMKWGRD